MVRAHATHSALLPRRTERQCTAHAVHCVRLQVTHAGMPVEAGLRSVLVASFSTRTPASPPDRVHGLQRAPAAY